MYADALLRPWLDSVRDLVPGVALLDAHTHTGSNDPDGFHCSVDELVAALADADARAVVFTMNEPDGYAPANDRVIAEAAGSDGRLIPFCRLDPGREPVAEARRSLDAGARGIKLHPRANTFKLSDSEVDPIFALAAERGVPVLVHAGRGIEALGRDALALARRYPDAPVILAHAAVSDLAWIWRRLDDHPNVFFDTSWWTPTDLMALFSYVPPGRILFGSDIPYGSAVQHWILIVRAALQSGLTHEQLRMVGGRQVERLIGGEAAADLGPAPGPAPATSLLLDRVQTHLLTAIGRMLIGNAGEEYVGLARLACEVGDEAPEAPVCRSILALLDRLERDADGLPSQGGLPESQHGRYFPSTHVAVVAAMLARTPDVPVPQPEPESVGERQ